MKGLPTFLALLAWPCLGTGLLLGALCRQSPLPNWPWLAATGALAILSPLLGYPCLSAGLPRSERRALAFHWFLLAPILALGFLLPLLGVLLGGELPSLPLLHREWWLGILGGGLLYLLLGGPFHRAAREARVTLGLLFMAPLFVLASSALAGFFLLVWAGQGV